MRSTLKTFTAIAATAAGLTVGACGGHKQDASTAGGDVANPPAYGSAAATTTTPTTNTAPAAETAPHHGKLKGALVGAAVGHVLGGHAVAGAAAGALIQHERNKHP